MPPRPAPRPVGHLSALGAVMLALAGHHERHGDGPASCPACHPFTSEEDLAHHRAHPRGGDLNARPRSKAKVEGGGGPVLPSDLPEIDIAEVYRGWADIDGDPHRVGRRS